MPIYNILKLSIYYTVLSFTINLQLNPKDKKHNKTDVIFNAIGFNICTFEFSATYRHPKFILRNINISIDQNCFDSFSFLLFSSFSFILIISLMFERFRVKPKNTKSIAEKYIFHVEFIINKAVNALIIIGNAPTMAV